MKKIYRTFRFEFSICLLAVWAVSPRFASTKSLFVLHLQLKAYPEGAIAVMATV